ncbi:MAG: DUF2490 domain-containing protein [Phycisphaerales bacterium]|nr:DUF2490 domain-containing protein [Phycisphaerales bacterium]
MINYKNILLLILLFIFFDGSAQKSKYGNWLQYYGTGYINNKWSVWIEAQVRNYDFNALEQTFVRSAIQYHFNKDISVSLGYTILLSESYANYVSGLSRYFYENRIYQQFYSKHHWGRFYLWTRYRFEERFFDIVPFFELRGRLLTQIYVPLNRTRMTKGAFYLAMSNELFVKGLVSPNKIVPSFDRDRVYGGIGYVFLPNLSMEVGNLTQLLSTYNRSQVVVMLNHTFSFNRKREKTTRSLFGKD